MYKIEHHCVDWLYLSNGGMNKILRIGVLRSGICFGVVYASVEMTALDECMLFVHHSANGILHPIFNVLWQSKHKFKSNLQYVPLKVLSTR